jgi:hypothetical protein
MMLEMVLAAPAETTQYMIAGYTVIFGVMLIYVISLNVRYRNLKRDYDVLKQMEEESE